MSDQPNTPEVVFRVIGGTPDKKAPTPVPASSIPEDPFRNHYVEWGILEPPHSLAHLATLPEYSDLLPTVLDVWTALVARVGYSLKRWKPPGADVEPDVPQAELDVERARAEELVASLSRYGWQKLRERSWTDRLTTAGRYFEVVRDPTRKSETPGMVGGLPIVFEHLPSVEMRICSFELAPRRMPLWRRSLDGSWILGYRIDYVRRYVRDLGNGLKVWYKQYGDQRELHKTTGRWLETDREIEIARAEGMLATEIVHDADYSTRTPYGVSKLVPLSLDIVGNREAAEANYNLLHNGLRVPFLLLVSGGLVSDESIKRMESRLEEKVGQTNWHGPVVLDAQSASGGGDPLAMGGSAGGGSTKMDVVKLREVFDNDAMFLNYIARNDARILHRFRVPPLLVGETASQYNYATAFASLQMFEDQVARIARDEDDALLNERLFPEHGIKHWVVQSRSIPIADYGEIAKLLEVGNAGAAVSPNEFRLVLSSLLRIDLPPKPGAEYDMPVKLQELLAAAKSKTTEQAQETADTDRKSTRLNSSHLKLSRMPSSA